MSMAGSCNLTLNFGTSSYLQNGWLSMVGSPSHNYAKVSQRRSELGSRDLLLISCTYRISVIAEAAARSVSVVYSVQPLQNYFGILLNVRYSDAIVIV